MVDIVHILCLFPFTKLPSIIILSLFRHVMEAAPDAGLAGLMALGTPVHESWYEWNK